jgi:hypothetical protein
LSHLVKPTEQTVHAFPFVGEFVRLASKCGTASWTPTQPYVRIPERCCSANVFSEKGYRNWNVEDTAMENHDSKSSRLGAQWRRYEKSETTVAAIFGGIAALFIAGIAAAFLYAKDTNPIQTASAPASPVTGSAQSPSTSPTPETTGSGAANTPQPKQQPGEAEQKKRQ